jgi:DNA mismatch repair protein MutS
VKSTEYITNDISLGVDGTDGMLLYGLNGGGKTVLVKSVASNIILAQAGLPVAASEFIYFPYSKIFTRMSGNDNMYKGESSFTLEMSELRSIVRYADSNSLMIGDEICRGTEITSALSIVMAAINKFSKEHVQFIFATHLHQLNSLELMKECSNVRVCHLHIEFKEDVDNILYYRKLREGPGPGMYGLEVMKHHIKDISFLTTAFKVRDEILNIPPEILQPKSSKYNKDLYVHECEICKKTYFDTQLDVHHIKFQCTFDNDGMLGRFAKDELNNLVVLCKEHHQQVHSSLLQISGWINSTSGRTLLYEYVSSKQQNDSEKTEEIKEIEIVKLRTDEKRSQLTVEKVFEILGVTMSKKDVRKIDEIRGIKRMTQKMAVERLKEDGIKISVTDLRKIWR